MKPMTVALLCAACCFGAAGTSFLLFQTLHLSQDSNRVSPAPVGDAGSDATGPAYDDRALLNEIDDLRRDIENLRYRSEKLEEARSDAVADSRDDQTDEEAPAAKVRMEDLTERLDAVERATKGSGAMRESAALDLIEGNRRERRDAAEMLGMLARGGDEAAKQALLDALGSDDADVREEALEGIGRSQLPEFIPALKDAMHDEDDGVRQEVAEALRDMPIEEAGPVLTDMLTDENPRVLIEAVDAIGDAGYENARLDIYPLTSHENERVALEAAIALRRTGDSSVAEDWVRKLGERVGGEDAREGRRALWQLRRMNLESTRPYFEQALESDNWRVRRMAQRTLDDLDDE